MQPDSCEQEEKVGLGKVLSAYWDAYGGWRAVASSVFLWASIALLCGTYHFWATNPWWDLVLSVMPNLLGFTLGGFAIFLGFGDDKFKSLMAGRQGDDDSEISPYMVVCSAFLHFTLVQVAAIAAALLAKGTDFDPPKSWASLLVFAREWRFIFDMFGYWLFLYGLSLAAASAIAIFQIAMMFDHYKTVTRDDD